MLGGVVWQVATDVSKDHIALVFGVTNTATILLELLDPEDERHYHP